VLFGLLRYFHDLGIGITVASFQEDGILPDDQTTLKLSKRRDSDL